MIEHKQFRKERSESGKKGASSRWSDSSAIGSANAKERKGKEIKEKESKYIYDNFGNYQRPRKTGNMQLISDVLKEKGLYANK